MNCINPKHKHRATYARGLCVSCYRLAWRLVKEGLTTWLKLENAGKANPCRQGATQQRDWILKK